MNLILLAPLVGAASLLVAVIYVSYADERMA